MKTYFLQVASGPVKIGRTLDLNRRLSQISRTSYEAFRLLGYIEGDEEKTLHGRFAESRIGGEWFRPTRDLLTFISEHSSSSDIRCGEPFPRRPISGLRAEIKRSGLSQRQIAEEAGISESALSNILAGRRTPGLRTAQALLALLRRKGAAKTLTVENTFGGDGRAA